MQSETSAIIHSSPECEPLPLLERVLSLTVILVPFAALVWAMVLAWGRGFDWLNLGLLGGGYAATSLAITVGFHRLFAHRAYETSRIMQATLTVLGSMAVEGPLLRWVAIHRSHHQHSDRTHDPHSPHTHGAGLWNLMRGFWWAHAGWWMAAGQKPLSLANCPSHLEQYITDLKSDRLLRILSLLFPLWVMLGLLIPSVLAGVVTRSWSGALLGLLWGGLVRIFLVHHVTWSINSVCHIWGTRPFKNHDHSRNNVIFGLLAWGEGWHNNHHAFPTSARHGLRWWQLDVTYLIILLMSRLGLAWSVRTPPSHRIAAKLR